MAKLTILHLSDLHWSPAKATDQKIVIDALLNDIDLLRREDEVKPDLVIFTGDLVQSGTDFEAVNAAFLDRVRQKVFGVPIIVVPGNHDIQRDVVRGGGGYVEAGLKTKLTTVDAVNSFVDQILENDPATLSALQRLDSFSQAYPSFGCPPTISDNALLKTHKLTIGDMSVGVANFNTAWRATGESENADRHQLLLGERNIDIAVNDIMQCDVRIAIFHHPLDWLADFDNIAVSSRLYAEFDLLAFGHSHRTEPEAKITSSGTAILSQSGCLYEHRDYFNGYQVIELDLDLGEATFWIRTYFNRRRAFDKAVNIASNGLLKFPYAGRTRTPNGAVERFLRTTRPVIRQAAADQVNIVEAVTDLRLDPKEAFICPPFTIHKSAGITVSAGHKSDLISVEDILRATDNFLIVGPREAGKSTLAHYMAVLVAEGTIDQARIPAVIDFRHFKLNTYGLTRAIATYYGATKQGLDIEASLKAGEFLMIVDNFSGHDKQVCDQLKMLIDKYPSCRWILLGDAKPGLIDVEENEEDRISGFRAAYIQPLPRKSIRELSRRWCEPLGIDNQKAFSAVMAQLREANLPRTGYMVTLLLWGLYQERQFERINEALLLTYVVDHLLGKANFAEALHRTFDPTSKEITLQYLAELMRASGGILPKNQALSSLINFFLQKGLPYDASEVLNRLIKCGLLIESDGVVSFKYRCFEEYFFANLLRNNPDKLSSITENRAFLEYSRELELLAGLRRQNKDLLYIISSAIELGAPQELRDFNPVHFDDVVQTAVVPGFTPRRLEDIRKKRLTVDQIDDLMDATEREASARQRRTEHPMVGGEKVAAEPDNENGQDTLSPPLEPGQFMAAVDLLGRVLRNSEFTDAADKISAAKLHLRSTVQIMLLYMDIISGLIDELTKSDTGKTTIKADEKDAVKYIILKIFFLFQSSAVNEQVATEKLAFIYDELAKDSATSTAEHVLIAMMMLETSHPSWLSQWETLIERFKNRRLILDLLMECLWRLLHTRPLSDQERVKVETAAGRIESAFGLTRKVQHSELVKTIRNTANQTAHEEDF